MTRRFAQVALLSLVLGHAARAQDTVVGSPHDLSASGPGRVHALTEEQVCIFCHAPHNSTGQKALWNRLNPFTHYRIYESSTTDARIDQPSGPSKMCLSCHDGAIAVGLVASRPATDPIVMSFRTIPPGSADLTEDLSDDHPIGFRYDRALARRDRQLKDPQAVTPDLPMGRHDEVHCTTCHDPHNNELGDFLRITDVRSAICLSCHDLHGWEISAHAVSGAAVAGRSVDRNEVLPYSTVGENGCAGCHKIHSADFAPRLLRGQRMQDNCLACHDGGTARTNLASELRKPSSHRAIAPSSAHDPAEDPRVARPHVECADCHNPHAVRQDESLADRLPGGVVGPTTQFVSGVNRWGNPVSTATFEYEICFKCHGDNIARPDRSDIVRQAFQTNTRLEFQPNNPSFHPVVGPRGNSEVVSLISPLRVGSVIRCTDCHSSDSADRIGGVSGPHGSIYEPLLRDRYVTDDFTPESPQSYALCYRCHERASILGDESFPLHNAHVVRGRTPCSACHDPHGVRRTDAAGSDHTNLINFDLTIVQPVAGGGPRGIVFDDRGPNRGSCTLTCHGVSHVNFEYGR